MVERGDQDSHEKSRKIVPPLPPETKLSETVRSLFSNITSKASALVINVDRLVGRFIASREVGGYFY